MAKHSNNRRRTNEQDARSGGPRARNAAETQESQRRERVQARRERQRRAEESNRRQRESREELGGVTEADIDESIERTARSERDSDTAAARRAQAADDSRSKRAAFNKAFAEARRRGKMTFSMNGKTYGTRKKGETKEQHKSAMEGKGVKAIAKKTATVSSGKKPTLKLRGSSPSPAAAAAPKSKKEVRATKRANRKNARDIKRDAQRGGATFRTESAGRAAQRKEFERIQKEKAARKGARAAKKTARLQSRLDKLKGKAGLKMVKGKDGKMVPFYAADGKGKMMGGGKMYGKMPGGGKMYGKMPGGGKMHAKKYGKMAYGGKMMKAESGTKTPDPNRYRVIPEAINPKDPKSAMRMKFMIDGKQVSSQDFTKAIRAESPKFDVNSFVQQGVKKAGYRFDKAKGQWSYSGQNQYMKDTAKEIRGARSGQ